MSAGSVIICEVNNSACPVCREPILDGHQPWALLLRTSGKYDALCPDCAIGLVRAAYRDLSAEALPSQN